MHEIALFVEDFAHQEFLEALLHRLSDEYKVAIRLDWRSVRRGHGAVLNELKQFLRDLQRERAAPPDLVIVATDANCMGLSERLKQITEVTGRVEMPSICAIPDPHLERWLLLDSEAFKSVFGRGCSAPNHKCEKARFKKMLIDAILASSVTPSLGGIEFAKDIVQTMDLDRAGKADVSFARLMKELRNIFNIWSK
jgi:hypothetical protein